MRNGPEITAVLWLETFKKALKDKFEAGSMVATARFDAAAFRPTFSPELAFLWTITYNKQRNDASEHVVCIMTPHTRT